jgi:hypothetical protein
MSWIAAANPEERSTNKCQIDRSVAKIIKVHAARVALSGRAVD